MPPAFVYLCNRMRMSSVKSIILALLLLGGTALGQTALQPTEPETPTVIRTGLPGPGQIDLAEEHRYCEKLLSSHGLQDVAFTLGKEVQSLTGAYHLYTISWQGIKLHGRFIRIHLSTEGDWISVAYSLPTLTAIPSRLPALVSAESVEGAWRKQMGAYESRLDTLWTEQEGRLIPTFRITTFSHQEAPSWDIYLDARSGVELYREDRAIYLHHTHDDTTGMGRVFMPNPCTAANVDYGDLFVDSADAHQAIFETLMDTVVLKDITWDENDAVFRLSGPYVELQSIKTGSPAPATSADGTFYFRRDSSSFEDVMVYYHIDRFQRYVQSLGYLNLQNEPIAADAHGFTSDVSAFVPNNGNSYLLFGTGNVDDAEDADVIVHEYIHVLSYAAAPETNSGRERRGLDEGLADYFAAAYSYDITPDKWHLIFNWDGHNEFWDGRIANTSETYPPANSLSIYAYGEIWSSALMKMRLEAGASVMDQLALESMYDFIPGMTLYQAGRSLIVLDSLLNNGQNREVIRKHLCAHEIDVDPLMPCLVVNTAELEEVLDFRLAPNPSDGKIEITWNPEPGKRYQVDVINMLGKTVWSQENIQTDHLEIEVDLPDASYLLRFRDNNGRFLTKRLVILRP